MVGMSRSGNHAIIDWILAQARGRTCFLNCAEPRTNPFVTARPHLFASRVASSIGHVSIEIAARIWCQHAREFLGLRRHFKNERVMVSYNDWVTSRDYRHALALRLGFEFEDSAANAVARTGGGSSFDGTVHDRHALDMCVLERWRGYVGDPYYARAFTPEVLQLADRIFGIATWEPQFQAAAAG